jgi:hypothetical protein
MLFPWLLQLGQEKDNTLLYEAIVAMTTKGVARKQ